MGNWKARIPDGLCYFRIAMIPVLLLLAYLRLRTAFLIGFIISYSTDGLDGLLARRWKVHSERGAYLDSLADTLNQFALIPQLYFLLPEILSTYFWTITGLVLFFAGQQVLCRCLKIKYFNIHLWTNKSAAVIGFSAMVIYLLTYQDIALFSLFFLLRYAGMIEECLIYIIHGKVDPNTYSLLLVKDTK